MKKTFKNCNLKPNTLCNKKTINNQVSKAQGQQLMANNRNDQIENMSCN